MAPLALALFATAFVASSSAASPVTITAANDANNDGVFSSSETIPASATYPLTVAYQITIDGHGLANAPITIRAITDSNTSNIGTCAALINQTIDVNAGVTCSYSVTLNAPQVNALVNTVSLRFNGGDSTTSSSTVNFAPMTVAGGDFVIGDLNAAIGTNVTFWGAQWWKQNGLSGGKAPAAFKGFETTPAVTACGQNWSTAPGNSPPPPAGPLPNYMIVVVSSGISQSGSTISGDTEHLVIVKTNAGYDSNPGHAGTGTVVAQIC
jgi:hypothetical protein